MTGERDPRAWRIDDDPFDRMDDSRPPPSYSRARDDGSRRSHVRVVKVNMTGGRPFFQVFGEEPQARRIPVHKGSIWHFSSKEVEHLAQATLAFALALAFMSGGGILGAISSPAQFIIGGIFWIIPAAPAFIIHEIAHKVTARKYGCWAEFRASPSGLRFGVFLAALTSIVFMAPGAVMVAGNTSRSQFGKIALAGPVSNIMLWALGIVLIVLGLETTEFTSLINGKERGLLELWCWVNVGLGTFNMLPFGPLDGKKIKTWSDSIYWIWAIVFIALIWFNINILPNLL